MGKQVIAVAFIWLATIVGNLQHLASPESFALGRLSIRKRAIGIGLIVITTSGLIWQLWAFSSEQKKVARLTQVIKDSSSQIFNEASGGTATGNIAYLVDDEKPRLFKLKLNNDDKKYEYEGEEIRIKEIGGAAATDGDESSIDDLEAISCRVDQRSPEKLYLTTSHSNSKKGSLKQERQRLVEVTLAPGMDGNLEATVTNSQANLRKSIAKLFDTLAKSDEKLGQLATAMRDENVAKKLKGDKGVIQIEGLAIDAEDNYYLGFRSPLVQIGKMSYALVLRGKLSDMFSSEPTFDHFLLSLQTNGISSIDFDSQTRSLLLIGNDPDQKDNDPHMWQWHPNPGSLIQNPRDLGPIDYDSGVGKPELLLLPPGSDRIYLYLDTDAKGRGDQIFIERSKLNLKV